MLGEFPENIFPDSELIIAKDGNLYGTALGGEAPGYNGVVFRVAPSGEFNVIHYFDFRHGSSPNGPLFQAADGHLYGTTRGGGTSADGKLAGGGQFYRIWLGALAQADEATAATWNSATLHGTVDPGEYPTTVSFQYGTDPGLVRFANVKGGTVPAGDPASVSATVRVLPGRTYYFRVVTLNAENPVPQASEIRSFTTPRRPSLRELLGLRGGP